MRKGISILAALCLVLVLTAGCAEKETNSRADVIFLENLTQTAELSHRGDIEESIRSFCESEDLSYACYSLTGLTEEKLRGSLDLAKSSGVKFVVASNEFRDLILSLHSEYPTLTFLLLDSDIAEGDVDLDVKNVCTANFNMYELGWLTGYLVPYQGFTRFALLDRICTSHTESFAKGIAAGISAASDSSSEEEMTFSYINISESDDNAVNQIIYQNILTETDGLTYCGDSVEPLVSAYAAHNGTHYVSMGTFESSTAAYQAYMNYESLIRSAYHSIQSAEAWQANRIYGYTDGAVQIRFPEDASAALTTTYSNLTAQLSDGTLTIQEPAESLEQLSLPGVRISIDE